MSNRKRLMIAASAFIGVLLLVWACIAMISHTTTSFSCWRSWGTTSFEWRVVRSVCQISHPSFGWIPADKFRVGGE